MKKLILIALLAALVITGCSGSRVVADPNVNNQRLNGLAPMNVYEVAAVYPDRHYLVVCTIEPLKYFSTFESHNWAQGWRRVATPDGSCQGWAFLP